MTTIIVFFSSLFLAAALISFKAVELRCGKRNATLSLICRLDSGIEIFICGLKFRWLQLLQSLRYLVFIRMKTACKNLLEKAEEKIINEYKAKQSSIMGHKDILNKGSVSFYLKKITEDRSIGERGKIEEVL